MNELNELNKDEMAEYLKDLLSDIRNTLQYLDDPKRMTVTEDDYEKLTKILELLEKDKLTALL